VYPYFRPKHDKSIFRFPPLGLGYIASYLMKNGVSTDIVDCTFLTEKEAIERVKRDKPKIVGIYSMFSMKNAAIHLAELLKNDGTMLVAGGPLPTLCPEDFIEHFDAVAVGEGEKTMLELVQTVEGTRSLSSVKGIAYKGKGSKTAYTQTRDFTEDLDSLPFPARDLFDNQSYKTYYSKNFGYTSTSLITSRGCPFNCDFCSRAIFGNRLRARSATNVVDEIESVKNLGYDRVWFADDCFTLNRNRLLNICEEMVKRKLEIDWECLSRVDTIDRETALMMKEAGCVRVFFGIESGNDKVLALMKKKATTAQAKRAVLVTKYAGIQTGAFFIVGYPGETDQTVLETLKFASSLPLDYLSFTVPYPIPGTPLYDRVKDAIEFDDFSQPRHRSLTDHKLIYRSTFSENKLKFAILKGTVQFKLKKYFGAQGCQLVSELFNRVTDWIFKLLR
jgi:anaerobic magnesium-protoporphyrin IX monomethyl ester cyclase